MVWRVVAIARTDPPPHKTFSLLFAATDDRREHFVWGKKKIEREEKIEIESCVSVVP